MLSIKAARQLSQADHGATNSDGKFPCDMQVIDTTKSRTLANHAFELVISQKTRSPSCLPVKDEAEKVFAIGEVTVTQTTTTVFTTLTTTGPLMSCIPQPPQSLQSSQNIPTTTVTTSPGVARSTTSSTDNTMPTAASSTFTSQIPSTQSSTPKTPEIPVSGLHSEHHGSIIGGTVGGLGALAVIIGLGFAFRRYRKHHLVSQAHITGFHEVKNGVNLASFFSRFAHSGGRQMILPMSQNNQSSSPVNERIENRPSAVRSLSFPYTNENPDDNEPREGAQHEMEAARRQRQILESDLEERLSHRELEDDNVGHRGTETEQRLRDGIRQMSRRIAELEIELEMELQTVGLPPPGYVSPIPVETLSRTSVYSVTSIQYDK